MRPATAPETILRAICRELREQGARVSVYAASDENALATGSWPGVCDEIGLVLVGAQELVQVQVDGRVAETALANRDRFPAVLCAVRQHAALP